MMESLRNATQNTMFEQWLDATMRPALQTKQTKQQQQVGFSLVSSVAVFLAVYLVLHHCIISLPLHYCCTSFQRQGKVMVG